MRLYLYREEIQYSRVCCSYSRWFFCQLDYHILLWGFVLNYRFWINARFYHLFRSTNIQISEYSDQRIFRAIYTFYCSCSLLLDRLKFRVKAWLVAEIGSILGIWLGLRICYTSVNYKRLYVLLNTNTLFIKKNIILKLFRYAVE